MQVHEPVSEWVIIVTELSVPDDPGEPRTVFNTHRFQTLQQLREYFFRPGTYAIAQSLAYKKVPKPRPEQYAPRLIGRLSFEFKDRFTSPKLEFNSAPDFARFLSQHPILAAAVEFEQK